jgi:hypothetical protein
MKHGKRPTKTTKPSKMTPCGLKFSEKQCYGSCVNYEQCKEGEPKNA